jgi:hypothetical protein
MHTALDQVVAGEQVCTPEQVERARLWHWLYRGAGDVVSGLVPHWEFLPQESLFFAIGLHMRYVESVADPLFVQVEQMWREREPLLARYRMPVLGPARPAHRHVPTTRSRVHAVHSAI